MSPYTIESPAIAIACVASAAFQLGYFFGQIMSRITKENDRDHARFSNKPKPEKETTP